MEKSSQGNAGNYMTIDIYIHGEPLSRTTYSTGGKTDPYVSYFPYAQWEDCSLIVETKVLEYKIWCYYTYIRKNITRKDNRLGCCALTLKSDYCIAACNSVYQILDIIYKHFIIGKAVSNSPSPRFLLEDFNSIGESVCNSCETLLSKSLILNTSVSLDDSFLANAGEPMKINPLDLQSVDIVNSIKKAEKLIISPSALSMNEKKRLDEYKNKIDFIKHDTEKKYDEIIHKMETEHQHDVNRDKKKLMSACVEIENLSKRCKEKDEINKRLEIECVNLKSEISTLQKQYTDLESSFLPTWTKLAAPLSDIQRFLISKGVVRYNLPELNQLASELRQINARLRKEDINVAVKGIGILKTDVYTKKHRFSKNQILIIINIIFLFLILCLTLAIFTISVGLFSYPKSELQDPISETEELYHEQIKEIEPSAQVEDKRVKIIEKESESIKQHDKWNN